MSDRSAPHRIGIDLGGTKIEGVILDPGGKELLRKRIPTQSQEGYGAILERIGRFYAEIAAQCPGQFHTLGLGTPGAISARTGLLKNSNTTCLNEKPFKQDLERIMSRPVEIQNDANCFALAEGLMGAGRGHRVVFGVIMGTGCGGGIMIDGKIHVGHQRIAGEWGHMSIDPSGPECYCGSRGCVETFISGGGLENLYRGEFGVQKDLKTIVADHRSGDPSAKKLMTRFFDHFGRSAANLIAVLDPDAIVLGGGLSEIEELYSEGVAAVRKYVFNDSLETPIFKNHLGDSAGVLGAALVGI